jgi:hypothetical protein
MRPTYATPKSLIWLGRAAVAALTLCATSRPVNHFKVSLQNFHNIHESRYTITPASNSSFFETEKTQARAL